ncbi:MAG: M24 family metallopeptidase [Kiritimatiellia bacterium]
MKKNPFAARLAAFAGVLREKQLDAAVVFNQANVRSLTGIDCDNACLLVKADGTVVFHTDFRYVPMVHRVAPWLKVDDIKKVGGARPFRSGRAKLLKMGYESSVTHARFMQLEKAFPGATFADIDANVKELRAVKTADELAKLRAAEALNDAIWSEAQKKFKPGMTEKDMARVIQHLMIERGDGEAFETIVCVGKNAAECHHVPDDTVWNGREPVLVDMGVKLDGYCSDMTRNMVPARPSKLYKKVYGLVLEANRRAIAAAKPGMTAGALDKVARDFLTQEGFGKAFGHSLGHGVGIEIHEAPWAARKQKMVLRPGMSVTIEPGLYLEGNLGVRIEDLVLITETGCEVISHAAK